jgi:peptidoglycan-associated lipoprotein
MKKLAAVIAASFVLVACASTPKTASTEAAQPVVAQSAMVASNTQAQTVSQAEIDAKNLAEQQLALKSKSVYFDFDKSAVKSEYREIAQQQANFIKSHGNDTVTIEGNCDERGSSKYNLALGEKRANAVREELETLGVSANQIKTVSFGKEKPRSTCHEEKCWKENRRVDFIHQLN